LQPIFGHHFARPDFGNGGVGVAQYTAGGEKLFKKLRFEFAGGSPDAGNVFPVPPEGAAQGDDLPLAHLAVADGHGAIFPAGQRNGRRIVGSKAQVVFLGVVFIKPVNRLALTLEFLALPALEERKRRGKLDGAVLAGAGDLEAAQIGNGIGIGFQRRVDPGVVEGDKGASLLDILADGLDGVLFHELAPDVEEYRITVGQTLLETILTNVNIAIVGGFDFSASNVARV